MPIHYVSGDIFFNRYNAGALAHGCNCNGSMGAGIAVIFKQYYPAMYEEYHRLCKSVPRQFNVGDAFLWNDEGKPSVFNLGTQENTWNSRATYDGVRLALEAMKARASKEGIERIAMPRIGAGLGGLSWYKVKAVIDEIFGTWSGNLYVYEQYIPEGNSAS